MPKTTKTKREDVIENANNTIESVTSTIDDMMSNMEILNENMQGAIDQIEEIQAIVNKMRDRMGL